jgi:hypothetical protein
MNRFARRLALASAIIAVPLAGASPAGAITAELAKKCRAMALKAHPSDPIGSKGGTSAKAQRDYYTLCLSRDGDMPASEPAQKRSTGKEQPAGKEK